MLKDGIELDLSSVSADPYATVLKLKYSGMEVLSTQ